MKIANQKWQNIKAGTLVADIAMDAGYNRKTTYDVMTSFTKIFPKHLLTRRIIHIPRVGTFFLKKAQRYLTKTESVYNYDQIKFSASRHMRDLVNKKD